MTTVATVTTVSSQGDATPVPSSATPSTPTWPTSTLSTPDILERITHLPVTRMGGIRGRRGAERILSALTPYPGQTWQQRWIAAGCDAAGAGWVQALGDPWRSMADSSRTNESQAGIAALLCLDVVRPSYAWLHQVRLSNTYETLMKLRDPDFVDRALAHTQQAGHPARLLSRGLLVISKVMAVTGKTPGQLAPDDVVDYRTVTRQLRRNAVGVDYAWQLLTALGGFPRDTPPLWQSLRGRPPGVAQIVDSYAIACQPVRDVLVRYLTERAPAMDYSSLRTTAWKLCRVFWLDLEQHHPGLASLHLAAEVAEGWKQRLLHDDAARTDPWSVLATVRSFYLDIAHWATTDAYWATWAAPCPIRAADGRAVSKHRKRVVARMHQKVRSLAPLMPAVLRAIDTNLDYQTGLLAAARETPASQRFTFHGREYEHQALPSMRGGHYRGSGRIWVIDIGSGERVDQTLAEDRAFWTWAAINTFYYTGVRLEELVEITQTALFTYRVPDTGEVVPLLQIVPSKTDAERVLLVPPELAHVLARVRQRARAGQPTVPLVCRYDPHERTTSPPLPYLFQRVYAAQRRVIAPAYLGQMITTTIAQTGITGPDRQPIHVTPHDFRRIFATDAVSGGLPVHIVAKLLGHESLTTTETYTAIYPEDVLRHYRGFITRRRTLRPTEEYREPTDAEWAAFHQHFGKRKVELGTCGRGYATPCIHEHACIRCPMLQPDPGQADRLEVIITNLGERITEARERGWHGEVEGLQVSLAEAREKRQRMHRIVELGVPGRREHVDPGTG